MKKYYRVVLLLVLALNLLWGYHNYRENRNQRGGDANVIKQLGKLAQELRIIRQNYVSIDRVSSDDLLASAMEGMAKGVDPYSEFMRPHAAESMDAFLSGRIGGIGVITSVNDGHLIAVHVIENSPAYEAGLKDWDEIVSIDGEDVKRMSYTDAVEAIRGNVDTEVTLGIQRIVNNSTENLFFTIKRANISMPSVWNAQIIENTNCAYINVESFIDNTARKLEQSISKLTQENPNMDSIILDLRGNGGGLLDCAVQICSFFLPKGQLIVSSAQQNVTGCSEPSLFEYNYYAKGDFKVNDNIKLAILIDRNSASASEITAGCLQDLGRAIIVGEKSFGKGSVQTMFDMGDGCLLKLTFAYYNTPNKGRVINGEGITPDIKCETQGTRWRDVYSQRLFNKVDPSLDPCVKTALEALGYRIDK